ncbi:MAG: MFS transporter, partial [Betaproteobacteria bacterium]|nr:MFS transporter [Betaproteobacteria bacterium]
MRGLASGFPEFVLARFIAGLGAGWVQAVGLIVLADISEPQQRGRMMAIYQGSFLFAVGIGPLPGGWLAQVSGLATPFIAYACASMLAGLMAWFVVEETGTMGQRSVDRRAQDAGLSASTSGAVSFYSQIKSLLGNRGFALICLIGMANAVVRTGGLFHIVPVLAV